MDLNNIGAGKKLIEQIMDKKRPKPVEQAKPQENDKNTQND